MVSVLNKANGVTKSAEKKGCDGYCGDLSYTCCKPVHCDNCQLRAPKWVYDCQRGVGQNNNFCVNCCVALFSVRFNRLKRNK